MQEGHVYCGKHEGVVVLRLIGHISCTSMQKSCHVSAALSAFLDDLFKNTEFSDILIDLTDTQAIDSTNLGLLARVAKFMEETFHRKATIVAPSDDIRRVLEGVAFDRVFCIVRDAQALPAELDMIACEKESDRKFTQLVLEAHRTLMTLSEKNREAFKDVVELMEKKAINAEKRMPA